MAGSEALKHNRRCAHRSGVDRSRGRSRLVSQSSNETLAAPKLDIATIDKAPGLLDGFGIISANQRLRAYKMPVAPDGKCPVLYHSPPLHHRRLKPRCPTVSARNRTRKCEAARVLSRRSHRGLGSGHQLDAIKEVANCGGLTPHLLGCDQSHIRPA
jgi:hypothetical protein